MNSPPPNIVDRVAVRRELHDDVEIGLEAFVAELVAAGVAAQHGPNVAAVDVDVDVADGADLSAARQLRPAVDEAVRIRQRLGEGLLIREPSANATRGAATSA